MKPPHPLGYLRVVVPLNKAKNVAALNGVLAVDVDETVVIDDPLPEPGGQVAPTPQNPPGASTPAVNPYMPTGDIGSPQFVSEHPTWDGRGTTIGIIDSGVDFGHPALQTTSTGERKIVDWVTATDPTFTNGVNNDNDPTWLNMSTQVSGPTFTQAGTTYTAPAAGTFRFAVFNERDARLGGEVGSDVNLTATRPAARVCSGSYGTRRPTTRRSRSNQCSIPTATVPSCLSCENEPDEGPQGKAGPT